MSGFAVMIAAALVAAGIGTWLMIARTRAPEPRRTAYLIFGMMALAFALFLSIFAFGVRSL